MGDHGEQDWRAAMSEIRTNVEVRRLMFVFMHVLLPGMVMAAADALSGADFPPELAWVPRHILAFTGVVLLVAGTVVAVVLARCHFGLVVNSMKMACVEHGTFVPRPLNWLGVTTSFVILCALSSAGGVFLAAAAAGQALAGAGAAAAVFLALLGVLVWNHRRANELAGRLKSHWERSAVPLPLRERHVTNSLEDCNADIAVAVTMAAALFTGFFAAMTNLGAIPDGLAAGIAVADLKRHGIPACSGYLVVSLLLTARMVLRLRGGIAGHSLDLAALRGEPDDPWRFNPLERTFLLYLVVVAILAAAAVFLAWTWTGGAAAAALAGGVVAVAVLAYVSFLGAGRRKARRVVVAPGAAS